MTVVVIVGAAMHLVEGAENGFTSIPRAMYWAIVTMTTVGYGDIAPSTVLGQTLASTLMILGYGIIAVPTGIVSAELVQTRGSESACVKCRATRHLPDANYCRICGAELVI
jgi:voltage-gated potassium channel